MSCRPKPLVRRRSHEPLRHVVHATGEVCQQRPHCLQQHQARFRHLKNPLTIHGGLEGGLECSVLLRNSGRQGAELSRRQVLHHACVAGEGRGWLSACLGRQEWALCVRWRNVLHCRPTPIRAPSLLPRRSPITATRSAVSRRPHSSDATVHNETEHRLIANLVRQGCSSRLKLRLGARHHLEMPDAVRLPRTPVEGAANRPAQVPRGLPRLIEAGTGGEAHQLHHPAHRVSRGGRQNVIHLTLREEQACGLHHTGSEVRIRADARAGVLARRALADARP